MKKGHLLVVLILATLLVGCVEGTGSLIVESIPSEASVYSENQLVGQTPLEISGLKPGKGAITIKKEGYEPKDIAVVIESNETSTVVAELKRVIPRITAATAEVSAVSSNENKPRMKNPTELVKAFLKLSWSGKIEESVTLWHDGVDPRFTTIISASMYDAVKQRGQALLVASIDLVDYLVVPAGYDRYIVTIHVDGESFGDSNRFLVQKHEEGFVILLPGNMFDSKGNITASESFDLFKISERPAPSDYYQIAMLANMEGDFATLREYTSSLVSDEFVRQSISNVANQNIDRELKLALYAILMTAIESVDIIDPMTIVLNLSGEIRAAMRWEDNMWKMLPEPGLEAAYENYKDGI